MFFDVVALETPGAGVVSIIRFARRTANSGAIWICFLAAAAVVAENGRRCCSRHWRYNGRAVRSGRCCDIVTAVRTAALVFTGTVVTVGVELGRRGGKAHWRRCCR